MGSIRRSLKKSLTCSIRRPIPGNDSDPLPLTGIAAVLTRSRGAEGHVILSAVLGPGTAFDMGEKHHPVFYSFGRFCGEIPRGHEPDFLGTTARPEFVARRSTGGMLSVETDYPAVNEEYFEWIDLLESVTSAGPEYTMAELGAGFGRWAVRAAFAAIQQQKKSYRLITVEAEPTHAQWLLTHFLDNRLDPAAHTLLHAAITEKPGEIPIYV